MKTTQKAVQSPNEKLQKTVVHRGSSSDNRGTDLSVERAEASLSDSVELLEVAKLFERSLVYEIKKSERTGDDEGARLKAVTLNLVRAAIAKAEDGGAR